MHCLVTRGNVAIYCYNALTAKTWDVTSSEDGKLTSSKTADTILAKYFSDFVNDNGEMKLVEDATVIASGANTGSIGANQIELDADYYVYDSEEREYVNVGLAAFIEAEDAPRKGYEDVTYASEERLGNVVAYVPADVANIATLQGKTVDVIFGKDNVVAYLVVTDDAYTNTYVTAFDKADAEIEIDGETYEFKDGLEEIYVFGNKITGKITDCTKCGSTEETNDACPGTHTLAERDLTVVELIDALFTSLACVDAKDNLTRNIVADFSLTGKGDIETINFKFSSNYENGDLAISEYVVTEVTSKKIKTTKSDLTISDLEKKEVRVVKNNEVATVEDIVAGNVITEVAVDGKIELLVVTEDTVEGEVADYSARNNAFEIDGEEYHISDNDLKDDTIELLVNTDSKLDEVAAETASQSFLLFEDQEVTAYLNMAGEVVALVGAPENTGYILGVVMDKYSNEEFEDSDEVEYLKIKILAEDGSNKTYKIYNEKSGKNIDKSEDYSKILAIGEGRLVKFAADEDRVIKSNKIVAITETAENESIDFTANTDVEVKFYAEGFTTEVDADKKTIDGKRFTSSTIVINPLEKELVSSWDALVENDAFVVTGISVADTETDPDAGIPELNDKDESDDDYIYDEESEKWWPAADEKVDNGVWVLTKGSRIVYIVANIEVYGASDEQYGILTDFSRETDEDGEKVYYATILVDGTEELTKEVDKDIVENFYVGDFVSFKVSDDEIKYVADTTPTMVISKDIVKYLEDKDADEALATSAKALAEYLTVAKLTVDDVYTFDETTTLEFFKVDEVATADGETSLSFKGEGAPVVYLADDCAIYDLAEGEEVSSVKAGNYVFVADYDSTEDTFGVVIIVK